MSKKDRRERKKQQRQERRDQQLATSPRPPTAPAGLPPKLEQHAARTQPQSAPPSRTQGTAEALRRAAEAAGSVPESLHEEIFQDLLKQLPGQASPEQTEKFSTSAARSKSTKMTSAESEIEISSDSPAADTNHHHGHHSGDYCHECGKWHETTFRLHDMLQRHVFLALADKYGITVYRNKGSHRSSMSVRVNPEFINSYFKPQLDSLLRKVNGYLAETLTPWLSSEIANLPPPPSDLKP